MALPSSAGGIPIEFPVAALRRATYLPRAEQFNRRTLAYRGFTFTLADKHLKNSLFMFLLANVPLDVGSVIGVLYRPLFRRLHRRVFIRRPRDLAVLRLRLRSRWTLSKFWQSWLGLGDRITYRSRDELWKECIGLLLDDCQVIVVDLSHARGGTLWEVQELLRRGYGYRTLFVVRDDDPDELAARGLLELGVKGSDPSQVPMLHRYASGDGRLSNADAFDAAYAAAVSSGQQPCEAPLPFSRKAILAIAFVPIAWWAPVGLPFAVPRTPGYPSCKRTAERRTTGALCDRTVRHWPFSCGGCDLPALSGSRRCRTLAPFRRPQPPVPTRERSRFPAPVPFRTGIDSQDPATC